jgi:hypothetical protein
MRWIFPGFSLFIAKAFCFKHIARDEAMIVALNFSSAPADLKVGATTAHTDLPIKSGRVPVGAIWLFIDIMA